MHSITHSRIKLLRLITVGVMAVLLAVTGMATATEPGEKRAVSIQGLVQVDGEDVIVDILVAALPGENEREKARAVSAPGVSRRTGDQLSGVHHHRPSLGRLLRS